MQSQEEQPLVAIQVAQEGMLEEVASQVGLGFRCEHDAALARGLELFQELLEIRPAILRVNHFRSHHTSVARRDSFHDNRIFSPNVGLLSVWLGRRIERPLQRLEHKIFDENNVFDAACYRPTVFSGLK
jgi:hypothetical protein